MQNIIVIGKYFDSSKMYWCSRNRIWKGYNYYWYFLINSELLIKMNLTETELIDCFDINQQLTSFDMWLHDDNPHGDETVYDECEQRFIQHVIDSFNTNYHIIIDFVNDIDVNDLDSDVYEFV